MVQVQEDHLHLQAETIEVTHLEALLLITEVLLHQVEVQEAIHHQERLQQAETQDLLQQEVVQAEVVQVEVLHQDLKEKINNIFFRKNSII